MKKLCVVILVIFILSSYGCSWKRNLQNEKIKSSRIAILAGEGYKELYIQSLLASELLSQLGTVTSAGVDYLLDIAEEAERESNNTVNYLNIFINGGEINTDVAERHLQRLKQETFKLSAAIRAFLANESIKEDKE